MDMTLDNFVGVFPHAVSNETCDKIIEHYEYVAGLGMSQSRQASESSRFIDKDNDTYFLAASQEMQHPADHIIIPADFDFAQQFTQAFWHCFSVYQAKYGILESMGQLGFSGRLKIQKNSPGGGYHVWHCEQGDVITSARVLLVILYLNDVEEGGETEFLYQGIRVPAKKGTMLICPGSFTHTHRGNPPLKGLKYIMNTWVELLK